MKHPPVTSRHRRRTLTTRTGGKATTYRLSPHLQKGLALLGKVRKMSANQMVNEAVGEYLESRTAVVEADLQETLRRVRAFRESDPNFESAIAKFAEAEATLGEEDPVEGSTTPTAGPVQTRVRELIRG